MSKMALNRQEYMGQNSFIRIPENSYKAAASKQTPSQEKAVLKTSRKFFEFFPSLHPTPFMAQLCVVGRKQLNSQLLTWDRSKRIEIPCNIVAHLEGC